jgi:phosphoglycolate phosphatase-like HAD superfamily hydrolase
MDRIDMEILIQAPTDKPRLRAALFDFDGTISTLRQGWEAVMEPLMLEMIAGATPVDDHLVREVREYIDQSTGILTIHQMRWLAESVRRHGRNTGASDDPWWYKAEYNRRLMAGVGKRRQSILQGDRQPADLMIPGSEAFLQALQAHGVALYVASGTDHPDVSAEVALLGLQRYFQLVAGAPPHEANCSKEMVLRRLMQENRLQGPEVLVVGDGKVEIALGRDAGAITLGVASDEERRQGVNPGKRSRLILAGAEAIVGDFRELDALLGWLGLETRKEEMVS